MKSSSPLSDSHVVRVGLGTPFPGQQTFEAARAMFDRKGFAVARTFPDSRDPAFWVRPVPVVPSESVQACDSGVPVKSGDALYRFADSGTLRMGGGIDLHDAYHNWFGSWVRVIDLGYCPAFTGSAFNYEKAALARLSPAKPQD